MENIAKIELIQNPKSKIQNLGIGLGFRPNFRAELFLNQNKVDFL